MSSVWLIAKGDYSDYTVFGVCSSHEKAKKLTDYLKERYSDIHDPEEIELDKLIPMTDKDLFLWVVQMKEDGTSDSWKERWFDGCYPVSTFRVVPKRFPGDGTMECDLCCRVWAKDQNHAVKIANEKRIQLIAEGNWVVDWKSEENV